MSKTEEAWLKFLGLLLLGFVAHKAAGKQAAALGLPTWAVTAAGAGLGVAFG